MSDLRDATRLIKDLMNNRRNFQDAERSGYFGTEYRRCKSLITCLIVVAGRTIENKWACRDIGIGEEGGWRFPYDLARENIDKEANRINVSTWVEANKYWRQAEESGIYGTVSSIQIAINTLEKNMKLIMGIQRLGPVQENVKAN